MSQARKLFLMVRHLRIERADISMWLPQWAKARLEAWFLRRVARALGRRAITRSLVISRRDNNYLFEVEHELRSIAKRIQRGYPE